ncbi:hypothetical protein [Crenothrix sp.]|uniref:hypothetical protein n=1 Tax=Crenothrix sp. TaxID=3100433 RepID=UPI00374D1F73
MPNCLTTVLVDACVRVVLPLALAFATAVIVIVPAVTESIWVLDKRMGAELATLMPPSVNITPKRVDENFVVMTESPELNCGLVAML